MVAALTASMEDYLEAIFHVIAEKQAARPKDIAKRLKVSNSSVTGALRALAERKLINYAPYDLVTLTPAGSVAAKDVVRRHEILRDFLTKVLAVELKAADEAACAMEHSIPKPILERLVQFAEFVEICPRGGAKWVAGFGYQCDPTGASEKCVKCITATLEEVKEKSRRKKGTGMKKAMLGELRPGQRGRVIQLSRKVKAGQRIVEMGVTPGAVLEVERVAPLGDPIDIKIRGYHLSLRKEDADGIEIEVL